MKKRAKRIHITSSGPRTGTTLLAEVMKTCFEIDCYCDHEAPIALSNSSFGECDTILTKMPSTTKHLEKVLKWDPNLFIICLIRDPRDMVCSYHGRIQDKYYCDFQFWLNFVENYKSLQGIERFLLIKYEDLTEDPDSVQKLIMEEMPFLSKKHNFSDFHLYAKPVNDSIAALKKLRPVESKGVGNWKNNLPRIKQQIHEFGSIESSLITYGYEDDNKWTKVLRNVELKDFQSYKKRNYKNRSNAKALLLTYLNIFIEKRGINPDRLLAPFKRVF
jgi:predicted nucleic acid-binding OB-fold protein